MTKNPGCPGKNFHSAHFNPDICVYWNIYKTMAHITNLSAQHPKKQAAQSSRVQVLHVFTQ